MGRHISDVPSTHLLLVVLLSAACGGADGGPTSTARTGYLEVRTATAGRPSDADGYRVVVDERERGRIGTQDTLRLAAVPMGDHDVTLAGVDTHCSVEAGAGPRRVSVAAGGFTTFEVRCRGGGPLRGRIVFSTRRFDVQDDLAVMATDGTGLVRLTDAPTGSDHRQPAVSPDGRHIAFHSEDCSTGSGGCFLRFNTVHVVNADGSARRSLGSGWGAAWSPDGTRIAFTRNTSTLGTHPDHVDVFVTDATGGSARPLTGHPLADYGPDWSPDGRQIVFVSERDGDANIYRMRADGSGLVRLTADSARDREPAWSPTDDVIAFERYDTEKKVHRIFTVRPNGTDVRALTPGLGTASYPAYSP